MEKVKGPASYFPSIEKTYGKPVSHWLDMIGTRLGDRHMEIVNWLKAEHGLPPADPAREADQIARLEQLALAADLDPEFAKKFLNFIIQEVIQHHKLHQTEGA